MPFCAAFAIHFPCLGLKPTGFIHMFFLRWFKGDMNLANPGEFWWLTNSAKNSAESNWDSRGF